MSNTHRTPFRPPVSASPRLPLMTWGILLLAIATTAPAQDSPVPAARPANWRSMRPPVEAFRPLPPARELIDALDSPSYTEREQASRLLTRHDQNAVPLLKEAARSDNPEVAIRAMNAIEGLWLHAVQQQEIPAAEAALKAMDELRAADDPRLLDRVNAIYAMHAAQIHEYSMHQVRRLGGSVRFYENIHDAFGGGTSGRAIQYIIVGRDWTGGLDGLRHVRRLSPSGVYFIKGADLPENIVEIFHDVPLEVRIPAVSRGASHLGVSTDAALAVRGCLITGVEPDSAADKAGMERGDMIEMFNNVEINEFQQLVDQIALLDPGETVPATIRRDGDTIELEVTLQEWK